MAGIEQQDGRYTLECGHAVKAEGPHGLTTGRAWCPSCDESRAVVRPTLRRYGHELPHQSQQLGRDLDAEKIGRNLGAVAQGYTLTDEQVEARRTGNTDGHGIPPGLPYRHLVYAPGTIATAWTAFRTDAELVAWADAYGITLEEREPGQYFRMTLPDEAPRSFAVVATDRHWIYAGPFATVDEAKAAMLAAFPVVEPWDGVEVNVAVADLARYWHDQREQARRAELAAV